MRASSSNGNTSARGHEHHHRQNSPRWSEQKQGHHHGQPKKKNLGRTHAATTGLTEAWKLWRHCCFRYGWYPLLVAVVVTTGCILSLVSSASCDFVLLDVGFTPVNAAWNQSTAQLGLFLYQRDNDDPNDNYERPTHIFSNFFDECTAYPELYQRDFIEDDRTWKISTVMAFVSGIGSIIGTVIAWLFVFSPLPVFFFWPGLLLPCMITCFLAEGSKFVFFDAAVCRNAVWFPSGADSLAQVAEDCAIGKGAFYGIAAGCTFFLGLIMVCLHAPLRRQLVDLYGEEGHERNEDESRTGGGLQSISSYIRSERDDLDFYSSRSERSFDVGSRGNTPLSVRSAQRRGAPLSGYDLEDAYYGESVSTPMSSEYRYGRGREDDISDLMSERLRSLDTPYSYGTDLNDIDEDQYEGGPPETPKQGISESRLNTIEKMQLTPREESDDMIQKFVEDLNVSFCEEDRILDVETFLGDDNSLLGAVEKQM